MFVFHEPADDVAAHPPQADHAELHVDFLKRSCRNWSATSPIGEMTESGVFRCLGHDQTSSSAHI
jgi:hypothetical protein